MASAEPCNQLESHKAVIPQDLHTEHMTTEEFQKSNNQNTLTIQVKMDPEILAESISSSSYRTSCNHGTLMQQDEKQLLHNSALLKGQREKDHSHLEENRKGEIEDTINKVDGNDLYENASDSTHIESPTTEDPTIEVNPKQNNSNQHPSVSNDDENGKSDFLTSNLNRSCAKEKIQKSDLDNGFSNPLVSCHEPSFFGNDSNQAVPSTSRTYITPESTKSVLPEEGNFKSSSDRSNTWPNIVTSNPLETCMKIDNNQNEDNDTSKPRIPGVRYDTVGHRWVASWSSGGKQIQRYFPNKKYGNAKARDMAISARTKALEDDFPNIKRNRPTAKDQKSASQNLKKRNYPNLTENQGMQNYSAKNSEKPTKSINLEPKTEQPKPQNPPEIREKNIALIIIPNFPFLISMPYTSERVPITSSNPEYSSTAETIQTITFTDIMNENVSNSLDITQDMLKYAKEKLSFMFSPFFQEGIS